MRILFVSPHSDPQAKLGEPDAGGQCVYEHELAHELAQLGHEVLTFCRQRNGHPPITRVAPRYTIYRITAGGTGFIPKEDIAPVIPEFVRHVIDILKAKPSLFPTVIHGHYWDGAMASILLKTHYVDYPMIWTPHSLGFSKREKYKGIIPESTHHFIPRLTWESYATIISNRIICSTRDEKRKLIKHYNVLPERIEIVSPGISLGSTRSAQRYIKEWGIKPGTHILLCLGRMARTKGYQHAIKITSHLRQKTKEKFVLVIVGGGSNVTSHEEKDYYRELKRLVLKLNLQDFVIFQPSVPHSEVQSLYSLSDFYLMTAEEEPFGLTVIEAMAAGCVVFAHNRGGSKNIIAKKSRGVVTDMHKYAEVADHIARLIHSPAKRHAIGQRASQAIHDRYTWSSRLSDYLNVYEQVASITKSRIIRLNTTDYFFRSITQLPFQPSLSPPRSSRVQRQQNAPFFIPLSYSL